MIDENLLLGWNYYWLWQVDVDGSIQFFGFIGVWVELLVFVYQVGSVLINDWVSVWCFFLLSLYSFMFLDV